MVAMTIRVTRVNAGGMPPTGAGPGGDSGACAGIKLPGGTIHDLSGTGRIDSGRLGRNRLLEDSNDARSGLILPNTIELQRL